MTPLQSKKPLSGPERLALKWTEWIGSTNSIIVHSVLFIAIFALRLYGVTTEEVLLILTTAVSLEAIYLAIFIQMTVNRNTQSLEEVEENIDEIQEDVESLEKDVDEIQEDIVELSEDDDEEEAADVQAKVAIDRIEAGLQKLIQDIELLKSQQK